MTGRLVTDGAITSAAVEAAFRAVPRHEFVPAGTPLEAAYSAAHAVVTKRDARGSVLSSASAPARQARMIGQAA